MYGARKPSGKGNIPARIERAKELKRAVDQKASVIEMDDCADEGSADEPDREDDEELEDKRPISPDVSFDFNPNEALFDDRGGVVSGPASGSVFAIAEILLFRRLARFRLLVIEEMHYRSWSADGLAAFAPSSQPNLPPSGAAPTRTLRSAGLRKPTKSRITTNTKSTSARISLEQQPKSTEARRARSTTNL
ncbi:hypothetical protein DVH05_000146 [Phytophthora capsici]|nr:hypothetical protein DVH05_000146 [Phytophthora capsici]